MQALGITGATMARKRKVSAEEAAWHAILDRVGWSPLDRLRWAVRSVERGHRLTAGEQEDLRAELAVFAGLGPVGGGAEWEDGQIRKPQADEVQPILSEIGRLLQAAVNRERVLVARRVADLSLTWDARAGRFMEWDDDEDDDWSLRARRVLARLLREYGHLLKECPAPAPKEHDGTCETWFVATRPRQGFCSPRCQSRAATRRFRTKPAVAQRRRRDANRNRKQQGKSNG
jgi:hypothetical protein